MPRRKPGTPAAEGTDLAAEKPAKKRSGASQKTKTPPLKYTLRIEAEVNGRIRRAAIYALNPDGTIKATDKADLADGAQLGAAARRLARKLMVDAAELETSLSAAWAERIDQHRRMVDLAAAGSPEAVPEPHCSPGSVYEVRDHKIYLHKSTREAGSYLEPLANFTARIVAEDVLDDGSGELRHVCRIAGTLHNGTPLPPVAVSAGDFFGMAWVSKAWGCRASPAAGLGARDHLRAAIQELSGDPPRRILYEHTGWREIGGRWHYLHGAGAIGPDGPVASVEVELPGPLAGYCLPDPPEGQRLAWAVQATLALVDGGDGGDGRGAGRGLPERIAFPLLGAIARAALGEAPGPLDFAVHLAGPHGAGKSELAALAQQHFGAGLDARHLPGNWGSTGNALEGLAFAAKDALFVVDDWAPSGAQSDRQRLERDADRLLRAQGNRSGRQRMRADSSLRPARPPRGLILSTGEDIPPGQSLRGRMLILEVSPVDVPLAHLTPHQRDAAAGLYAQALSGFVHWLAPQYGDLRRRLPAERDALRDRAQTGAGSARTPGIVADLALGLRYYLAFAVAAGAIATAEQDALGCRGWQALAEAAEAQAEHVGAAEPTSLFLRLLGACLVSGRAHVAGPDGLEPAAPEAWGWQGKAYTHASPDGPQSALSYLPLGSRVGWVDGEDLYLEPEASYAAAQKMAHDQGAALPISPRTLSKRLKERGLLASWDAARQRTTVRRTLEGVAKREVLHLRPGALSPSAQPSTPSTATDGAGAAAEKVDGPVDGVVDGCRAAEPEPSTETVHRTGTFAAETPFGGRCGRSDTGGESRPATDAHTEADERDGGMGDAWEGD